MAVTISRVARRRELDKLVKENETDKSRMAKLVRMIILAVAGEFVVWFDFHTIRKLCLYVYN